MQRPVHSNSLTGARANGPRCGSKALVERGPAAGCGVWGVAAYEQPLAAHPFTPRAPRRRDENPGRATVTPVENDTQTQAATGEGARTNGGGPGGRARALGGLLPWVVLGMLSVIVVSVAQIGRGSGEIEDTLSFEYAGGIHTEARIPYTENPGAGGPHHPVWQNCGAYTEELYDEHVVHSLEHGAVAITYRPGAIDAGDVEALTRRWGTHRYVILSPRDDLADPIVLTAWNRQLGLSEPDDPRIGIFVARYAEGPQAPESGAPCRGGTSRSTATPWESPVIGTSMEN